VTVLNVLTLVFFMLVRGTLSSDSLDLILTLM